MQIFYRNNKLGHDIWSLTSEINILYTEQIEIRRALYLKYQYLLNPPYAYAEAFKQLFENGPDE